METQLLFLNICKEVPSMGTSGILRTLNMLKKGDELKFYVLWFLETFHSDHTVIRWNYTYKTKNTL